MSNYFTRFEDNAAPASTVTVQLGTDHGGQYGPERLVDNIPAWLSKIDSVSAAWQFAHPAKVRVRLMVAVHGTFQAGSDLRFQGDNTPNWTSPAFSTAVTVPAWLGAGTGRYPQNAHVDLTDAVGYDPAGYLFHRLVCFSNDQNVQAGQVILSTQRRTFSPYLFWDSIEREARPGIVNETDYGVKTTYPYGTVLWSLEGEHLMTDASNEDIRQHWHGTSGSALPFVVFIGGRSYFVNWAESVYAVTSREKNYKMRRFVVEEVSRGLRPGV